MNEAEIESLRREVRSLRQQVRAFAAREQQLGSLVLPNPFEDETSDERIRNLERKIAAVGQGRESYKPVLLPGGVAESYFLAKITDAGPDSEANYEDERYWVIEQRIANTSGDSTADLTFEDKPNGLHVTATNLTEAGAQTHDLPLGVGVIVFSGRGQELNTQTGKLQPVAHYWFSLEPLADPTNPQQIVPEPEGTEAVDEDGWARDDPTEGEDGVKIKVHTRSVYNDLGDEKLYGFWRELTFDRFGRLTNISAGETRYAIETPGACP